MIILASVGCAAPAVEETVDATAAPPAEAPLTLEGDWCREKKRKITRYRVKGNKLDIVSGRSGRRYESDLTCNASFTECEGNTIRGWGSPVTEILRLNGMEMNLTRVWGGAWKGKSYNFTYTPCPRW